MAASLGQGMVVVDHGALGERRVRAHYGGVIGTSGHGQEGVGVNGCTPQTSA